MLQGEHSAILLTFMKQPFVIKIFVVVILSGRFTQVLLYIDDYKKQSQDLSPDGIFGSAHGVPVSLPLSAIGWL